MVYSIFIFEVFVLFFFFSLWMYIEDCAVTIEWVIFRYGSVNLEFYVLLDWVSLLFLRVVLLISSIIFIYRRVYIKEDIFNRRFLLLVFIFVISIVLIVLRPNIYRVLFGWDGLGLVSYCLVIYYQNSLSYWSGIVTVLCNRVGDIGLILSIGLIVVQQGRCGVGLLGREVVVGIIILAAMTKRAQIPFSSWLPMAIAAPTPVSALVHSSTLVTAGVYLMIRFNEILMNIKLNKILFFFSVLTMFISGLIANVEYDLKKIIALSTLRQLGLIIIVLRIGFGIISLFHLLTHAIFKSLLFMCAGIMIHLINNNQDIRRYGTLNEFVPFTIMRFYLANLSLCGFPFMAGYYSKDWIIEIIYISSVNFLIIIIRIISLILTVSYSLRLMIYVFFGEIKFRGYIRIKENRIMNFSIIILIILSVIVGRVLWWLFIRDIYISYLRFKFKIVTLMACLIGIIIGLFIVNIYSYLIIYKLVYFLRSMWFLNYFIKIIYKPFVEIGERVVIVDKIWVEYLNRLIVKIILVNYTKFRLRKYKIYIFILIFIRVIILLYFIVYLNSLRLKYDIEDIMIIDWPNIFKYKIFINIRILLLQWNCKVLNIKLHK